MLHSTGNSEREPWVRWSYLVRIAEARAFAVAWPAFAIIPVLAVVLTLLRDISKNGQSVAKVLFGDRVASILDVVHYPTLMFFWYFAFLFFALGVMFVRTGCPELISKHRNIENYLAFISKAKLDLRRSAGGPDTPGEVEELELAYTLALQDMVSEEERKSAGLNWVGNERKRPMSKFFAVASFVPSLLLIGWGTFVFIPAQVMGADSLTYLLKKFFLIS